LIEHAGAIGADLQCLGRDFGYVREEGKWIFWGRRGRREGLPHPALRGACQLLNASACLAVLDALGERLPVGMNDVRKGLATVEWPGRFQVLPGRPAVVLDVAHNPQAAAILAQNLADMGSYPATHAVFGMLRDKDIEGVCAALQGRVSVWYAATLADARGAEAATLAKAMRSTDAGAEVGLFDSPRSAFEAACKRAGGNDRILVFGSFYTVAEVMALLARESES